MEKVIRSFCFLFLFIVLMPDFTVVAQLNSGDYPIQPKSFEEVQILDNFWAPKIKVNHEITIPIAIQKSLETGRIDNFKIAGNLMEGKFCSEYPFDDSDVFKIIEAASYSLQTFPDKNLDRSLDSLIYFIEKAQESDGYLYTNRTIGKNIHPWAGERRWEKVNDLSHELYNLGHLFEAATAHFRATGKTSLLNVAIKAADLVDREFGYGRIEDYPGHQEIELGLVKLYRVTKDPKYLNLAKFFLDIRGQEEIGRRVTYNQSHQPVTEQSFAVGHSVRATYMWIAMADVAAITGNQAYISAIERLWHDVVDTKMYVIGGIGATGNHEGFDDPYVLPNMSAYNETCAGIGNALWNHRMFLMSGNSKYIDVMERTMYNNILSGVSMTGDRFFYPNPLSSYGQHERSAWFGCACCPPNVARFLPYMPGLIYANKLSDIYINLFVSSETEFKIGDQLIQVGQQSSLPHAGDVTINVNSEKDTQANLKIRIPGWARNRPIPSELYTYYNPSQKKVKLFINGVEEEVIIDDQGYVNISRIWLNNTKIKMELPYEIKKVLAHENLVDDRGKMAIERGPIVYCAEWATNPDIKVLNGLIEKDQIFTLESNNDYYMGVDLLKGSIYEVSLQLNGNRNISDPSVLTLIPYYLWNNKGPGHMQVWMPYELNATRPLPAPTIASKSNAIASIESKSIIGINDQQYPTNSGDRTNPYLHWWPKKGTTEWVQYNFEKKSEISKSEIYWYDDGPDGGCRIPDNWHLEYWANNQWVTIQEISKDAIKKDDWNSISFKPIITTKLKLVVTLNANFATGIQEWIVE